MDGYVVSDPIPASRNAVARMFGRILLRALGWRIEGTLPAVPKFLVIGAPHTSNWDFVIGMAAKWSICIHASWMGKHTLFWPPLGWVLRSMGGIPIDRSASLGVVGEWIRAFDEHEKLVVGVTPEGTRKQVYEWKSGFWHIAKGAGVPIVLVYWDYKEKVFGLGPSIMPSEDKDEDLLRIKDFYRPYQGKHAQTVW